MSLSNFARWQSYMSKVVSPQSYVDFGYFYLISAALQRRVWCPPDHARVYANLFIIFVGEAGTGKGVVIKPVLDMLQHHKIPNPSLYQNDPNSKLTPEQIEIKKAIAESNYTVAQSDSDYLSDGGKKGEIKSREEPLLIALAADATTFEALIRALARSVKRQDYEEYDTKLQKITPRIYTHSSLCFCLEEISSLFRRNSENVVKLLLNAYDCGDYVYDTKTQGKDKIRKCCLNFLGGTTPAFIRDVFDDKILDDGFSSRTMFLFESKNRGRNFFMPELSSEQIEHREHIRAHVGLVAKLYGAVNIEESTKQWLEEWIQQEEKTRVNRSSKLTGYYARKNLHVMKLGMAIHFGETLDMNIPKSAFEKAIEVLAGIEKKMHFALDFSNKNPLFNASKKLVTFLTNNGEQTKREILVELAPDLPDFSKLEEVLEYCLTTGQIDIIEKPNRAGVKTFHYKVIPATVL